MVDLAAGTGRFTALIADAGAEMVAADSVDAVVVAQAFHWFDARRAMAELGRVVRGGGGRLGLVWNVRDRGVDWVDQVWSVMDRVEKRAPWRDHRDGTGPADGERWREHELVGHSGWAPFVEATFQHVHHSTHDSVVDRVRSVSHVAVLSPARQAAVLNEIRTILREHPDTRDQAILPVPYRVDAMYAERLG